jgi:3'-phosphoadenosine 5'-phosphosulfate sulfotransferase (PAPS reductase)/FAD synthetase
MTLAVQALAAVAKVVRETVAECFSPWAMASSLAAESYVAKDEI